MATCKVVTEKGLMLEYGETPEGIEEIKRLAADAEAGVFPTGKVSRVGRPSLASEATKILAFRIPTSKAEAFERKARENGETKSQAFRELVDAYLEA